MNITRFTPQILLLAMFVWVAGCATPRQNPDPLNGWTFRQFDAFVTSLDRHHYHLDKAIIDDYQGFITKNKLSTLDAITGFYEDGTGQHAVRFVAFPNNQKATWQYVIIYDKENQRIRVIKYGYRRFPS